MPKSPEQNSQPHWTDPTWWTADETEQARKARWAADGALAWWHVFCVCGALAVGASALVLISLAVSSDWLPVGRPVASWPWFRSGLEAVGWPAASLFFAASVACLWWLSWQAARKPNGKSATESDPKDSILTWASADRQVDAPPRPATWLGLLTLVVSSVGPLWGLVWLLGSGWAAWGALLVTVAILIIAGSAFALSTWNRPH
jgi:hypothetical protein